MIDSAVNARIQDMRIASKISLSDEETEFDDKYLTKEQLTALLDYYRSCTEERLSWVSLKFGAWDVRHSDRVYGRFVQCLA